VFVFSRFFKGIRDIASLSSQISTNKQSAICVICAICGYLRTLAISTKNITSILVKALIGIACLGLLAQRLYQSYSVENMTSVATIFNSHNTLLILLTGVLMFLNWGIEVYKWGIITQPMEIIPTGKLWQSVWMGVCIGNLTPGRLGEFAGRVLVFKPENRAKGTTLHFVNGITQLVANIVVGCIGLLGFSSLIDKNYYTLMLVAEVIILIAFILFLVKINNIVRWLQKLPFLKKYDFSNLEIEGKLLVRLLFLSTIRYFVFFFQFYLLLIACGVHGNTYHIFGAIAIMYLLLSTIPMISVIEVAVRAFIIVLLFGSFGSNDWELSVASTLLWVINIVFPSVVGYVFLVRNKFTFGTKQSK
jgi:uncharacterized membrane protein YbhN (UPF0104 family)